MDSLERGQEQEDTVAKPKQEEKQRTEDQGQRMKETKKEGRRLIGMVLHQSRKVG